jgi:hypothetical protein
MPPGSGPYDAPRHHKNGDADHHLSRSQLELLTLATLFRETGGRLDGLTTWIQQKGWDKILKVAAALQNGTMPIPKTATMQSFFASVFGVKWERNHVVAIDLSGNGLTGAFPADIVRLRFLTTVKLRRNPNLHGTLPREMYAMPHLKYCYLDGTKVEKALPYHKALAFQISQLKAETGKFSGAAIATVTFCTGHIHWMADMTETEMQLVHATLKKLHDNVDSLRNREQIKCTASNATGPERAAAATKLQRIYRARMERTKFRTFLHSLVEMKVDPATGYTFYVNARTGEATWEKPTFLGSDADTHTNSNDESSGNNASDERDAWKPYDDGNGNTVSLLRALVHTSCARVPG